MPDSVLGTADTETKGVSLLLPRLEYNGVISAHCNHRCLGSSDSSASVSQGRINKRGAVFCPGKERGTSCEEREHSRTYIPIECKRSLCDESSWLELRGENSSQEKERDTFPVQPCPASLDLGVAVLEAESYSIQWLLGDCCFSLQSLSLPLLREGSFKGILMIPTRSSVGTRERRMDLMRMASPFPVWMSWKIGSRIRLDT
ncbi:hypothetical protein AAY473_029161 [Plecturocebus cupreus]